MQNSQNKDYSQTEALNNNRDRGVGDNAFASLSSEENQQGKFHINKNYGQAEQRYQKTKTYLIIVSIIFIAYLLYSAQQFSTLKNQIGHQNQQIRRKQNDQKNQEKIKNLLKKNSQSTKSIYDKLQKLQNKINSKQGLQKQNNDGQNNQAKSNQVAQVSQDQQNNPFDDEPAKKQMQNFLNQLKGDVYDGTDLIFPQVKFNAQYPYDLSRFQNPQRIVDIKYDRPVQYSTMPINPLKINRKGEKIYQTLYDENRQKEREQSLKKRKDLINNVKSKIKELSLIQFNLPQDQQSQLRGIQQNKKQWLRLENKYNLSSIKTEKPICVVMGGINNNKGNIIEANLNSIFTQNYTNYKVILIDDASVDGTVEMYKKYFMHHQIDKKYYTLISNSKRITAIPNYLYAVINHCSRDSIVISADQDDQLIGRNIFQVFNWAYQAKKAAVIYSNNIIYKIRSKQIFPVYSYEINESLKDQPAYRKRGFLDFSHLKSYRAQLFYHIDPSYFQYSNGQFIETLNDCVLFFPMLEVACGSHYLIERQIHYLYYYETGTNDADLFKQTNERAYNQYTNKKPLQCNEQLLEKIQKS